MAKYLEVSFYTLAGLKKVIDIGDFSYGKWVIYDKDQPKYIVNVDKDNESDKIVNELLSSHEETIESLLKKINRSHNTHLSLKQPPLFRFIKTEKFVELDLNKLPEHWLKNIH